MKIKLSSWFSSTSEKHLEAEELRIQITPQQIDFVTVCQKHNTLRYEASYLYKQPLEEFLKQHITPLQEDRPFKDIICISNTTKYSLIPSELIHTNTNFQKYLEMTCVVQDNESTLYQRLEKHHITQIYSERKELLTCLENYFGHLEIQSLQGLWLTDILDQNRKEKIASKKNTTPPLTKLYIYAHQDCIDICIVHNYQLQLLNKFKIHTPNDILYYSLYTIQQLGYDLKQTELIWYGKRKLASKTMELIKLYVKKTSLLEKPKALKIIAQKALSTQENPILFTKKLPIL